MAVVCVALCFVWYRGLEMNVVFIVIDSCMVLVNDEESHEHFEPRYNTRHKTQRKADKKIYNTSTFIVHYMYIGGTNYYTSEVQIIVHPLY